MAQRFDSVTGAHERFQESDLEGLPDWQVVEPLQQALYFGPLPQVAAGDVVAQNFLAIFLQAAFVRLLVNAMDGGRRRAINRPATASLARSMNSSIN
jgi:hypothetical protein